jgi:hypothetical protein
MSAMHRLLESVEKVWSGKIRRSDGEDDCFYNELHVDGSGDAPEQIKSQRCARIKMDTP